MEKQSGALEYRMALSPELSGGLLIRAFRNRRQRQRVSLKPGAGVLNYEELREHII